MQSFDLTVIGTGVAARTVASRVRAAGRSVAVVDRRRFGGTCALRGCDPKKVLVGGACVVDRAMRMQGQGVVGAPQIAWRELIAFKRSFTDPVPTEQEKGFAEKGIVAFHGHARFTGRNRIDVEGSTVEAKHIVIAAGAEPVAIGVPGETHLITSEDFMALEALPERIAIVGGGYIAAELSHIAARAGARVTILERGPRLLAPFDSDVVGWLMERFRSIGIEVHTGTAVDEIDRIDEVYRVRSRAGGKIAITKADLVVHAAGRVPSLEGLDLERGDVAVKDGRPMLNDYLQSVSNAAVYVAGDAANAGPPLTPVASYDAKVVAANLLEGNRHKPDYRGVPSVAFTIPPLAAVGLDEEEARRQGLKLRVTSQRASDWYTARQAAEPVYGFKIIVDDETDGLLGAHIVGPHADELINVFAIAIQHGLTAHALKRTLFAYPTAASDIGHML